MQSRILNRDPDWRNFSSGLEIPALFYVDQPYFVVTPQGAWVCVLTTGEDREGSPKQFVASTISTDQGHSWSELVPIEPAGGPNSGWAVPLITPSGRIYAFYTYNGDNIHAGRDENDNWYYWREKRPDTMVFERNDLHGWYVFKYSDDGGRTWSPERYRLSLRPTTCDQNRTSDTNELVQLFWGVCRPMVSDGVVYLSFTKMGQHFQQEGEGWLLRSDNILTERDPARHQWQMLPDGNAGIRNADFGSVQEEHIVVPLYDRQSIFCMYRTEMGHPASAYSRDGGQTWSKPEPARYSNNSQMMRNPRACPMVWRCQNGKYLFWFHNNGYRSYKNVSAPVARNLVWVSGGIEREGKIHWSQPELVQYDDHSWRGSSYPDLIEDSGNYYISSTQKTVARIAHIDTELLEHLWNQDQLQSVARRGLVLDLAGHDILSQDSWLLNRLPRLDQRGGFTIGLWVQVKNLQPGRVLVDTTGGTAAGVRVLTAPHDALEISFHDGQHGFCWTSDPGTIRAETLQHVVFIVDGGPRCVSVLVDGILCDGSGDNRRLRGSGRFLRTKYFNTYDDRCEPAEEIGDITGTGELTLPGKGEIFQLRLYDRYLWTSEAIGNWRAGYKAGGAKDR